MNFGEKLSALRKQHSMTQQELSEKLGISRQAISRWERMTSTPATENLISIGKLFGVSVNSLIDDSMQFQMDTTAQAEVAEGKSTEGQGKENIRITDMGSRIIFNKHTYLLAALFIFVYDKWLRSVHHRNTSVFTSKYVIIAIGPLFTLLLMMYVSLAVFRYTDRWKRGPPLVFGLIFTGLCYLVLSQIPTIIIGGLSPYFALVSVLLALSLHIHRKRKEKI